MNSVHNHIATHVVSNYGHT